MSTLDDYAPGIPCWVDLMTPDPAAAAEFYSGLFGWNCVAGGDDVGGYIMADLGGRTAAGIGGLPPGFEVPPVWSTYIATTDAEATLARVADAGGTVVLPAMSVEQNGILLGRMARFADPSGAVLGIWELAAHRGAQAVNEPGALTWNELLSRDVEASRQTLSAIFDWDYQQIGDGENFDYTVIKVAGGNPEGVGGVMKMPDGVPPDVPSYWNVYFLVEDTDATAAATLAAGGMVLMEAMDSPQGRMASLADPQGAVFSVISPMES